MFCASLIEISRIESVDFIFRPLGSGSKIRVVASTEGEVLVRRRGPQDLNSASSIWVFNDSRTVRIKQQRKWSSNKRWWSNSNNVLVPIWDNIIPYAPYGQENTAVIEQGGGLSFYSKDATLKEGNFIPTTYVAYKFSSTKG